MNAEEQKYAHPTHETYAQMVHVLRNEQAEGIPESSVRSIKHRFRLQRDDDGQEKIYCKDDGYYFKI